MISFPTWVTGAGLAAVIALTAARTNALSASGAMAAWLAGTVAMGAGWDWGTLLVGYFVASSALTRWNAAEKLAHTGQRSEKSGARDAAQVAANGGVFVAAALAWWISPHPAWTVLGLGALTASAADTWATEVGSLIGRDPRSILTGATVRPGTSGGVSIAGFAGSLAAAAFMAALAAACGWSPAVIASAVGGGLAGSVLDSVLGAGAQGRYWCAPCDSATERRVHHCGATTSLVGGRRWIDNDVVNAIATAAGATVALVLYQIS